MKKIIVLFLFLTSVFTTQGQVRYWIFFTDKPHAAEKVSTPQKYLSQRALDRRAKQNIEVDVTDIPVHSEYVKQLKLQGVAVLQTSKWLNGVSVFATKWQIEEIKKLAFVHEVKPVVKLKTQTANDLATAYKSTEGTLESYSYGPSTNQIFMMNGQFLHNEGSRGQGMLIAVLDGGFTGANEYTPFDYLWERNGVVATWDFVDNDTNVFHVGSHGMSVLSVMAGLVDGQLIGTAHEASYLLLKSEDQSSETTIEEDNWVAAAEFADSAGADIINSSLGYTVFDGGIGDYTWDDLDGRTATTSKAAVMAARKGILVVNSAGNEGGYTWQKILTPADADSILAVGGVDAMRVRAGFSSTGNTADGRIKPDIAAQGAAVYLATNGGGVGPGNGTSFSAPLISGLSACLWQRHPEATAMEIRNAIMQSASQHDAPDSLLGYGIPDFYLADFYLSHPQNPEPEPEDEVTLMPNPFTNNITLYMRLENYPVEVELTVFDENGKLINSQKTTVYNKYTSLQGFENVASGMYVFQLKYNGQSKRLKMLK